MSFRLSQTEGSPTFRTAGINAVAVIPLLSSGRDGTDDPNTHSSRSFDDFLASLHRHNQNNHNYARPTGSSSTNSANSNGNAVVVVVPNSNLTRPGDWKYSETPLRNFHWGHGCQRLRFFDGRPYHSRWAHDRLINHELTRNWIDLCPHRRTASLLGVLNVRDCPDQDTLELALREWNQWAERYSTPPYEVTAHGRDVARDTVVPRLCVFDSFHEEFVNNPKVDLEKAFATLGLDSDALVAFPPAEMMELHVNVVLNDLAVAVFRELEGKIRESDRLVSRAAETVAPVAAAPKSGGFFGRGASSGSSAPTTRTSASSSGSIHPETGDLESPRGSQRLSLDTLSTVVSPSSELAASSSSSSKSKSKRETAAAGSPLVASSATTTAPIKGSSVKAQLLTPLDEFFEFTQLAPKDAHMMMKREVARREKFTADLCLLAGSPLDAYERYTKAADWCKTTSPDPLWYAAALEGCAAAHIAMADAGGFGVDDYLESSFQLPEELMACALVRSSDGGNSSERGSDDAKKSLPQVVRALCEDALNVLGRHPKLAPFSAELLLKLAWYTARVEDAHVNCQWGLGGDGGDDGDDDECCYGGDPHQDKRRWEMASATRLNFLELKNKEGEDVIRVNTLKRCQNCSKFLHAAAAAAALDPVTRADVALRCLAIAWRGVRATSKPTDRERSSEWIQLKRKAAFFAVTAAEAMSDLEGDIPTERANALWIQASKLLSGTANDLVTGNYGWATLRAVALHALVVQGARESSEEAAQQLLMLVSEISPPNQPFGIGRTRSYRDSTPMKVGGEGSGRNYSFAGARSYIRDSAKQVSTRSKELFGSSNELSSLIAVQSKWVEDDPLEPAMVPMGDFSSDFAPLVLELPSVWSTIRYENCTVAQERLIQQIYDLRKTIPASTLQNANESRAPQALPIEITSIQVVNPDVSLKLERVELKRKVEQKDHSMATFFNPYAKKERKIKPTTIPRGEEQYVSITFANKLAIPFDVDSCKLKFDTSRSANIKAPSISFVVPGQTKDYTVRFPFIVLGKLTDDDIDALEVKGIYITALSRSIFLPVGAPKEGEDPAGEMETQIMPKPASLYPQRDYSKTSRLEDQTSNVIHSPRLEITPPQPNIRVSFASSPTPMDDESIIPVLLADGEIFTLPKICIANDTGLNGLGTIEELQISAFGLPGQSEVVLFDMSGNDESGDTTSQQEASPISITATCVGLDADTLNSSAKNSIKSFIATKLSASPNMGVETKGCDVTLRFRYRGKAVSPTLEVWRKYEVEIKILRVKGPKIPSMSFRYDLLWDSGYSKLCHAFAARERGSQETQPFDENPSPTKNSDYQEFGAHVCSDEVVVMVTVANETGSPIVLSRADDSPIGFSNSKMDSLKVFKGVNAKFPLVLPRVERSGDVCQKLIDMTKFKWKSDIPGAKLEDAQETGGPMYPANCRVREGVIEMPRFCLKTIMDENPAFLPRICQAPCAIAVHASQASTVGKPMDVSVTLEMAKWLSTDLLKQTKGVMNFFCAKQIPDGGNKENAPANESESTKDGFVWMGQIRKNLCLENECEGTTLEHQARIMFLEEGDYLVSACLVMTGLDESDNKDAPEVWWSNQAARVCVSKRTKQ